MGYHDKCCSDRRTVIRPMRREPWSLCAAWYKHIVNKHYRPGIQAGGGRRRRRQLAECPSILHGKREQSRDSPRRAGHVTEAAAAAVGRGRRSGGGGSAADAAPPMQCFASRGGWCSAQDASVYSVPKESVHATLSRPRLPTETLCKYDGYQSDIREVGRRWMSVIWGRAMIWWEMDALVDKLILTE